jgi:hypothetical protein
VTNRDDAAPPDPPAANLARLPVAEWADRKQTPLHLFAGACAGERWPEGRELTEAEFDAAIARAAGAVLR